jgi:hypothetical protein
MERIECSGNNKKEDADKKKKRKERKAGKFNTKGQGQLWYGGRALSAALK